MPTAHTRINAALDVHNVSANTWQMAPLTVTIEMASALAITRPEDVALDGLLAEATLKRLLRGDFWHLPGPRESPVFVRLPLALQGPEAPRVARWPSGFWPDVARDLNDAWWWWACSTARLAGVAARDTHFWTKRFDTRPQDSDRLDFGPGRAEKIATSSGRYKAYRQRLPTVTCRAVEWSCVGDAATITDLLGDISFIGKKVAYGYGQVLRVRVEPAACDTSLVREDGQTLARPVPLAALERIDGGMEWAARSGRSYIAYRAPQWLPYNQALCAVGRVETSR